MPLLVNGHRSDEAPPIHLQLLPPVDGITAEHIAERCRQESHDCFFSLTSIRRSAWKQYRLYPKVIDPALADDPALVQASLVSMKLDSDMSKYIATIASSEKEGTQYWQRLTPRQRRQYGLDEAWGASAEQEHLIGQSFVGWPEVELPPDLLSVQIPRILRGCLNSSTFDEWLAKGVIKG